MDKPKLHTPDFTEANIAKTAELFPSCVVEAKDDKTGELRRSIDFDQLRQGLSDHIVEGPQERYRLDWPGKREALLAANAPIAKTLRPVREESVDFDTTQNLFIEGDNLDALKLLQETYLGKVKMIYIDPPYNTGNDFIYEDDFSTDSEAYLVRSNQKGIDGDRLVVNNESNGRFHSDWLTLIYSRLRAARNLLKEDGFILISIDDNERTNLQKICDEVFGEANFRGCVSRVTGTPSGQGYDILVNEVDYLLVYSKSSEAALKGIAFSKEDEKIYDKKDSAGRYLTRPLRKTGGEDRKEDRPSMHYSVTAPDGTEIFPVSPEGYDSRWRCGKSRYDDLEKDNLIEWKKVPENETGIWKPYQKFYLEGRTKQPSNLWQKIDGNKKATREVKELLGVKAFDSPKPVGLLLHCLQISAGHEDIILDFFAGSSTTAHAVMKQNAEDGGNRRFIMVQLPEACDEKSEAFKAGYKTIAEISKERIRRAGAEIKDEIRRMKEEAEGELLDDNTPRKSKTSSFSLHPSTFKNPEGFDTGFRVLKVDTSNVKDIYYAPDQIKQDELGLQVDHIKEDRTAEDLLFQVMLDWGVDLSLPVTPETIRGKQVYFVDENAIAACFETGIDEDFVKELAKRQPLRAVFRDTGYADDAVKINIGEIFKLLSPGTELKTI